MRSILRNLLSIAVLFSVLLAACSPKAASLDNTSWKLLKLGDKTPTETIEITASFHSGQITGKSACNSYFAEYTQKGSTLKLGPAGSTMMACLGDDIMTWESDYLQALARVKSFKLDNEQLDLLDENGNVLMSFGK